MFNKHPMPWKLWRPWTDELILLDSIIPNYIFIFKKWTSLCWLLSIGEKCRNNSAAMDNLTTGAHLIMNWVCKTRNGTSWPSSVASWNWVTRSWRGGRKSNGEKKISWSARGFCRINQSNLFHEPKSKAKVSQPGGAGLSGCRGVRSAQPAAARSWTSIPLRPGRERERERDSRSAHRAAVVGGGEKRCWWWWRSRCPRESGAVVSTSSPRTESLGSPSGSEGAPLAGVMPPRRVSSRGVSP